MTGSLVPQYIRHHGHHDHTLTLQQNITRQIVHFNCNACSHPLTGFYYHCTGQYCRFNIHPYCASMPQNFHPPLHHCRYPFLSLLYSPPHSVTCDYCHQQGRLPDLPNWLYGCNTCQRFHLHLGCAIRATQPMPTYTLLEEKDSRGRPRMIFFFGSYRRPQGVDVVVVVQYTLLNNPALRGYASIGRPSSNSGNSTMTPFISVAVTQLIGAGLNSCPLIDIGSSLHDHLMQLTQSLWG